MKLKKIEVGIQMLDNILDAENGKRQMHSDILLFLQEKKIMDSRNDSSI
jgi:hypothetical protein